MCIRALLLSVFVFSVFSTCHGYDGGVVHPVSTHCPAAQDAFNEGVTMLYAFNHDAAYRAFSQAACYDPQLAMAYWGMAHALGQTINYDISEENQKRAFAHIQKALELSKKATPSEKAYIEAAATRYSDNPKANMMQLRTDYKRAMEKVHKEYPDDPDAATLYAESMMNIHPWEYWTTEGKPEKYTLEVVSVLDSVLKRDPNHLGANHFYIHALEESKEPQRALSSANRLPCLLPRAGHILHMPSHIYILLGDYERAAVMNEQAIMADKRYIAEYGLGGTYPLHYMSHNYFFLVRARMWQGQYCQAIQAAKELENFYLPHFKRMPALEYYGLAPMQVYLYFHKWNEILSLCPPNSDMLGLTAFWYFARGMAYVGQGNLQSAEAEEALFEKHMKEIGKEQKLGYNSASTVLEIAKNILQAKIAGLKGETSSEIRLLQKAVSLQDKLHYNEPPDWFYPVRQTLGALLIQEGQYAEAEQLFRQALEKLPRNGRSLFGLLMSLKKQDKESDAYWVEQELKTARKGASSCLQLQDL